MHLKVFVKLKKTLITLLSGQKTQKNPLGWVLEKKTGFFPTLPVLQLHNTVPVPV
jgi:hypothetical protein